MSDRIIALIDMDCFYVQVEERENPLIQGCPAAVVQYNTWKGGGIIAVNYEARAFGVKRGMRGDEARDKCPDIKLVQVPVQRSKADLTKYRKAGKEVIDVLCEYSDCVERASIDEAYIELTEVVCIFLQKHSGEKLSIDRLDSTWVVGFHEAEKEHQTSSMKLWFEHIFGTQAPIVSQDWTTSIHYNDICLTVAAVICEDIRREVLNKTGFKCSAGISHNKVLGKLACGLRKPNQQTILSFNCVDELWKCTLVEKVRNLGGKLGLSLKEELNCKTVADLADISFSTLKKRYDDKTAKWLYDLGRGIDHEVVIPRMLPKSIGCSKNFTGNDILNCKEKVKEWVFNLSNELSERLEEDQIDNKRIAKSLSVGIGLDDKTGFKHLTKSARLTSYNSERIASQVLPLIYSSLSSKVGFHIRNLSLSASKFEDSLSCFSGNISELFKKIGKSLPKQDVHDKQNNSVDNYSKDVDVVTNDSNYNSIVVDDGENNSGPFLPSTSTKELQSLKKCKESFFNNFLKKNEITVENTNSSLQKMNNDLKILIESFDENDLKVGADAAKLSQDMFSTQNEVTNLKTLKKVNNFAENICPSKQNTKIEILKNVDKPLLIDLSSQIKEESSIALTDYMPSEQNGNCTKKKETVYCTYEPNINDSDEQHLPSSDLVKCIHCNNNVSAFEYPEHLDFHVAKSLQENFKREALQTRKHIQTTPKKRKKYKSLAADLNHKTKKIDSYFKQ